MDDHKNNEGNTSKKKQYKVLTPKHVDYLPTSLPSLGHKQNCTCSTNRQTQETGSHKNKKDQVYIEGNKINLSISFFLTLADSICPETITRNTEL